MNEVCYYSPFKSHKNISLNKNSFFDEPIKEVNYFSIDKFQESIQKSTKNKYKIIHYNSDETSWNFDHNLNPKQSSLHEKGKIPNLSVDEIEFFKPKRINTVNEMIIECEETDENDCKNFDNPLKTDINDLKIKNKIFDKMIKKYKNSDEINDKNISDALSHKKKSNKNIFEFDNIIEEFNESDINE